MTRIARLAATALLLSSGACADRRDRDDAVDRTESAAADAAGEVREETRDAKDDLKDAKDDVKDEVRDLEDYTYAQRDDFRTAVRHDLEEIDKEVAELGRDTRGAAGTLSESVSKELRDGRAAVAKSLDGVDDAAEDDWAEARGNVEQALSRLRNRIAEVRATSGPMGGRSPGQT